MDTQVVDLQADFRPLLINTQSFPAERVLLCHTIVLKKTGEPHDMVHRTMLRYTLHYMCINTSRADDVLLCPDVFFRPFVDVPAPPTFSLDRLQCDFKL